VSIGVTEREVAFAPVLIMRIADFDAEALQAFMLGIHIVDLNLHVKTGPGGSRLISGGMDDKIGVPESEAGDLLFIGIEFPPECLTIEFLAAREV
jgi:hypothetical protein